MLRKIAAGTGAAVVAACLAAAPAVAAGLPASVGDVCAAPSCVPVTPVVTDFSGARRNASPPVGTPVPEEPSGPPPNVSVPESPPPVDSVPPPSAGTASPPPAPEPTTAQVAPSPPPAPRAPLGGPGETVLPEAQPPARAPSRLPQTASDTRPLTVAGGGSLIGAGLAWIGGARRRKRLAD
jgi:LPXTG-motif cell wall-anchored protein